MERQRRVFIFVICFLRSCQESHSIGLTFDNQLVIVANDCYTRVAIGSKLSDADIFSSVAVRSISECEEECSKKRNSCNAFAFGIGIKGNGTCALSAKMLKPEDLQSHADYDVYVKSQRLPHCEPDRLYKMGNGGVGQEKRNDTRPTTRFGGGLFGPPVPSILSSPRPMGSMTPNAANDPSYQRGYMPSFDDERRISDILRNRNPTSTSRNPFGSNHAKIDSYNDSPVYSSRKSAFGQRNNLDPNNGRLDFGGLSFHNPFDNVNHPNFASHLDSDLHTYKALTVHNGPFDVFSRPIFVHNGGSRNKSTDFGFWSSRDPTKHRNAAANHPNQNQGFSNNAYKSQGIVTRAKQNEVVTGNYNIGKATRPGISSSYNFETNGAKLSGGGLKDVSDEWSPIVSTAFRGFGARINEKPKCKYQPDLTFDQSFSC